MQSNESFRLVVRRGPQPNQTFELNKDIITLGRDITNDIVINDPEVSRHHLRITRGASGYNIEDLGSTNGTFIGGQRVTGVRPLNRGDMIGLGETVTLGYEVIRPDSAGAGEGAGASGTPAPQPSYSPPQQEASPPPQYEAPSYSPPQQQQPQDQYGGGYQAPQQDYGAPQPDYGYQQPGAYQQGYGAPAGTGYDYDPYAVREEEPGGMGRWILIGCGLLALFCCCGTIVSLVIIDALSLWYDLPIIKDIAPLFEDIASALGLS